MSPRLEILPVDGLPEVREGDSVGALVADAAPWIEAADVVCVAQKAVSKAEGRTADLGSVTPGAHAVSLGREVDKDARLVELILAESRTVIRTGPGVLIVETRSGWICANAGIDASNVPGEDRVALLPEDPDTSARRIRAELEQALGVRPAVLVSDSFGRPWRLGQADIAIGCAGIEPIDDWRGRADRDGRELQAAAPARADHLAAAAELARDKASGTFAVVVRGLGGAVRPEDGRGAAALRRPPADDLFR